MPQPALDSPYAYRLPTDVALRIRDTAPPLVTMGSPRRRLIVLVLTIVALAGGMAAALPSGEAQAMVRHDCIHNPNWESVEFESDPANCW
jgi:hypothetical protein